MRPPARILGAALSAVLLAGVASAQAQTQPQPQPPAGMQWLYGSGEGGAASVQAYRAFRDYVLAVARHPPRYSVVMWLNATLAAPSFYNCAGNRRLAVVLDVDETALLNLGFEYDDASHPGRPYDQQRWNRWEQTGATRVAPVPGAVEALAAIRRAGVTVIFNSNRLAENAAQTEAALNGAGLGPAWHGPTLSRRRTLYLKGDVDVEPTSRKDERRAVIASYYCVIAMAGDQLGDFTDLFNADGLGIAARRAAATGPIARMWGRGWFILPNPVYGTGLRGNFDDVFPADRRWPDPQGGH
jgi:5'-nucleotidase (lipoprotein e(P4) family)